MFSGVWPPEQSAKDATFSHIKNQEKAMLEVIEKEQEQLILINEEIRNLLLSIQ